MSSQALSLSPDQSDPISRHSPVLPMLQPQASLVPCRLNVCEGCKEKLSGSGTAATCGGRAARQRTREPYLGALCVTLTGGVAMRLLNSLFRVLPLITLAFSPHAINPGFFPL